MSNVIVVGYIGHNHCPSQQDGPSSYIHNGDAQVGPDASSAWSGISFDIQGSEATIANGVLSRDERVWAAQLATPNVK